MQRSSSDKITACVSGQLRVLREKRGLSMNALAGKAGLDQMAISRIEKGERSPQLRTVLMICEALEVSLSDVLKECGG